MNDSMPPIYNLKEKLFRFRFKQILVGGGGANIKLKRNTIHRFVSWAWIASGHKREDKMYQPQSWKRWRASLV